MPSNGGAKLAIPDNLRNISPQLHLVIAAVFGYTVALAQNGWMQRVLCANAISAPQLTNIAHLDQQAQRQRPVGKALPRQTESGHLADEWRKFDGAFPPAT